MKNLILTILVLIGTIGIVQAREVSGIVCDEQGSPLPGVTVVVEKAAIGTFTDERGFYKLNVTENDECLIFSFIGMETAKVKIGDRDTINVVLTAANLKLEECVVVGYGISRKSQVTGAVSQIYIRGSNSIGHSRAEWNTENYASVHENGYRIAETNPLSTFSIDVDNASYANVRRFLNQGQLPPADAVRVEEMINYFSYDYPEPEGEHPFGVSTELSACPWAADHYLMRVGLKGKSIEKSELPASNLVFLIDVSGSMSSPDKLPLLKRAFSMLVNELRPQDRVSVVVYAGAAGMVLESTPGNEKRKILDALERLQSGGSTSGGAGLKLAYKIAGENFIDDGNNRIILATDGDFNVGVSSTSEMERLVEQERESNIYMSVLGFGNGNIKDDKMETIADKGNGNYAYIDNIQEARKVFISEFGGTLFTIAKDVKFQLEFNPKLVQSYRLIGYENRLLNEEDFNNDRKDAGEMGSGHTVTALYEIVPVGAAGEKPSVDPLKYQKKQLRNAEFSDELLTIKLRYKAPDGGKSKLMEIPLPLELAKETTADYCFAAAVASFGMLLRDSEFKGTATLESVLDLARNGKGQDDEGYRAEFIRLVKSVNDLHLLAEKTE